MSAISHSVPLNTNFTNFVREYKGRIHLAHQIKKINLSVRNLRIVHCDTLKQKNKLQNHVVAWLKELKVMKEVSCSSSEYVNMLFSRREVSSDVEMVVDSLFILESIKRSLVAKEVKNYLAVVDLCGVVQGIGVFSSEYGVLDYLATAPSNLKIQSNSNKSHCIRGVGTMLVREGMRFCLINGEKKIDTYAFSKLSRSFYMRMRFIQTFQDKKPNCIHLPVENMGLV